MIGDEFIPLLNKAGGAGFQVTAYTQTWSDVEARIGSQAKAGQIGGNFNTLIHGGQLHKIRMPLPDASHDALMPASLEAIGSEVRGRMEGRSDPAP